MSSQIGKVRTIRVFVEPVDIEVDTDEGLPYTSLQSAFPGSSGLYYKGDECKTAVRFDGKKFLPPGGHWNDTTYFVTLGSRPVTYPFGSYENASKQFERSVNAVQKMLGGSLFEPGNTSRRSHRSDRSGVTITPPPPTIDKPSSDEEKPTERVVIHSLQEREHSLKSAGRQLSPIEQQFVDLAKISTGKDTIIEQQREEINRSKQKIEDILKDLTKSQEECLKWERRVNAQEEELNILRRMSSEQTYMCDKVASLTVQVTEKELEMNIIRNDLSKKILALRSENADLQDRLSVVSSQMTDSSAKIRELEDDLKKKRIEIYEMDLELKRLRTLAKRVNVETLEEIECYTDALDKKAKLEDENSRLRQGIERAKELNQMFESNSRENARLLERNKDLEDRFANIQKEISGINDKWKETLRKREEDWDMKRSELEMEKGDLRRQLHEIQSLMESATRDVAETTRRLEEVTSSRDELRKSLEGIEYNHKSTLARETRTLKDQLKEAQNRSAELASLVGSLTSDAKNSRRDVSDIL